MGNLDYLSNAKHIREQTLELKRAQFAEEVEASFQIKLELIDPNPYQPRVDFSAVERMAESLREHGQYYPILVRRVKDRYQVADGETRLRAAKLNLAQHSGSPTTIAAVLKPYSDVDMAVIAFRTAYDRKELNPVEEARGLRRLHDELKLEYREIARRLGRPESYIYDRTRLLNLNPLLSTAIEEDSLSASAAIKLQALGIDSDDALTRAIALVRDERMTVQTIQAQKARLLQAAKPQDATDEAPVDASQALWRDLRTIWKHLDPAAQKRLVETASELAAARLSGSTPAEA